MEPKDAFSLSQHALLIFFLLCSNIKTARLSALQTVDNEFLSSQTIYSPVY